MTTKALRDAWASLVPDRRDDPENRQGPLPPLLLTLTLVTGLVDAFSYLVLGRVFVANMTGNVIFIAFSLAGSPDFSLSASVVALLSFAAGAVLGGRLGVRFAAHRGGCCSPRWSPRACWCWPRTSAACWSRRPRPAAAAICWWYCSGWPWAGRTRRPAGSPCPI
ncbi:YoaK family protein [Streptacidiphilus sp. PAMC 29251]